MEKNKFFTFSELTGILWLSNKEKIMRKLLLLVFLLFVVGFSPSLSDAEQTDTEKSIRELKEKIRKNPNDATAHFSLGLVYKKIVWWQ